jgi:hypothetical protein
MKFEIFGTGNFQNDYTLCPKTFLHFIQEKVLNFIIFCDNDVILIFNIGGLPNDSNHRSAKSKYLRHLKAKGGQNEMKKRNCMTEKGATKKRKNN